MIRNLLENAVHHANSRVVLEVGSGNGTAILAVSDDGPGISPAERARVFERFVRLDSDRARSGGERAWASRSSPRSSPLTAAR